MPNTAIRGLALLRRIDQGLWLPAVLERWSGTIFRFSLSLIFIVGGLGHFFQLEEMLERIGESPWRDEVALLGDPAVLLWLSGGVFVLFGLLLMFGLLQRLSAFVLFITLVPITLSIHFAPGHVGPLLKNVAILGALLLVYTRGSEQR